MQAQILAPAAVLVLWTLLMLIWMAAVRLPALRKAIGGGLGKAKPGGRGQDLDGVLPDPVNWKSHNHTHLHEQPTLFYATVLILALLGPHPLDMLFAWAYVAIRMVHSLWQATVNTLPVRFSLFLLSTICLVVLAIDAAKLALLGA